MIVYQKTNYTVYIPVRPRRMAVYLNPPAMYFPHSNGKKGKTLYNYQEEVAHEIYTENEGTIAVAAIYNRDLPKFLNELINLYDIPEVVVAGWSLGGNDAVKASTEIRNVTTLILIDANHTNNMAQKYVDFLRGTKLLYISDVYSPAKLKKVTKAFAVMPHKFLKLTIPKSFSGSNHRYCRDSMLNCNVFGYAFGGPLYGSYEVIE